MQAIGQLERGPGLCSNQPHTHLYIMYMYVAVCHTLIPYKAVHTTSSIDPARHLDIGNMATKHGLPPKTKYKFLSEPDDELMCLICLEVAEDPWQHADCGRLLCKKCLDKLGKVKPCPYCRKNQPQFFSDNRGG